MPHVFVVGPSSWNLLVHVAELPDPTPHTVFAEWFHEALGGTSAGKSLNLRRLGLDVTLSTLVGDDAPVQAACARSRDLAGDVSHLEAALRAPRPAATT